MRKENFTKDQILFKILKQQIQEFGDTYFNFRDEDLFTLWFLRAYITENEDEAAKAVVNGPNDKGIDAIFVDDKARTVFVVQAKYKKQLQKISEKSGDVTKFADLSEIIAKYDNSSFNEFLEDADELVKERLSAARRKIIKQNYKFWLYYVTLGKCSSNTFWSKLFN